MKNRNAKLVILAALLLAVVGLVGGAYARGRKAVYGSFTQSTFYPAVGKTYVTIYVNKKAGRPNEKPVAFWATYKGSCTHGHTFPGGYVEHSWNPTASSTWTDNGNGQWRSACAIYNRESYDEAGTIDGYALYYNDSFHYDLGQASINTKMQDPYPPAGDDDPYFSPTFGP